VTFLDRNDIRRLWPMAEASAQEIAGRIAEGIPPGFGFALLVFSFGPGGYITHVSNANRADLAKTMRELADGIEANADAPPGVVGQRD